MAVEGQRARDAALGHRGEADGVGEREVVVVVALEPIVQRCRFDVPGAPMRLTMVYSDMAKDTIAISVFKACCLAVLKRVKQTDQPIVVTKFGEPVAEIVPPTPAQPAEPWLGKLKDRAKITGDIVAPVAGPSD